MTDNTSINAFLGLNMNETGSTNLKLGESPKMVNWKISRDYKLEKMYGYINKFEKRNKIRSMWFGVLGTTEVFIFVCDGKVYNGETEIGTITDDITRIFEFNKKLYFINGHEYKEWDGTTYKEVEGYIPLVKISTTPTGVGTDYEPINVLTGKKHQTFSATGEDTIFYLAEKELTSIDKVLVNGIETTVTKELINGKITFANAPEKGADNIDVYWTKGTGQRELIYKNHYFQTYGLADDTRVFLYGNDDAKNRIYFSDLGNGIPDVTYFPGNNFVDIGSSNTAVTDIQRQYDRLIINKEDATYYSTYEQITDTTGNNIITFPVSPLNKSHGAKPYNQGQVLDNYVTTMDTSIVQWTNTESKDERNAQIISQKVQTWLNEKNLSKAVTLDYQEEKEYWLAIEDEILIYNYENGCYSLLKLPVKITTFLSYKGIIYAGTESGKIIEFNKDATTYGGEIIKAEWQSGYYDFGMEEQRKTMRVLWITLKPWFKTSLDINYISDRDSGSEPKQIENRTISYAHLNYARFTYNTQKSVKPFRVKLKAKKFSFLKLILKNEVSDEKVTVNSIAIKKAFGGEVK